jgi:hypothetical protein
VISDALCWTVAALASLPTIMMLLNLPLFRRPHRPDARYSVSVILPARNEAAAIGLCVRSLLASIGADVEIIVVDDESDDDTGAIVRGIAAGDARVRLYAAPMLPGGWSGKQHACHTGASQARHPILMFMDCDVLVAQGAVAAMAGFLARSGAVLVSGFPRERTVSLGEIMMIPLIHVVLLSYLPIWAMRSSRQVSLGAGCGQIMLADANIYRRTGGHAMIPRSWHDGLHLPRAFRERGYHTDIFDATALAECRMYHGFVATWQGLSKNARDGMATSHALPVWTLLLGGGFVAPFLLLPMAWQLAPWSIAVLALTFAAAALLLVRLVLAVRFRQSLLSVPLLPIGVTLLLMLQWCALLGRSSRRPPVWRGRPQISG